MERFTYLKSSNADYIDDLFAKYLVDPDSIDDTWRYFFDGLELGAEATHNGQLHVQAAPASTPASAPASASTQTASTLDLAAEAQVAALIEAYRAQGKFAANINPLQAPPTEIEVLSLGYYGLRDADLDRVFSAGKLIGIGAAKLRDILAHLQNTYCGSIAVEVSHIQDHSLKAWLTSRMEACQNRENLDAGTRKLILRRLTESEGFERFLHTRYVAQKRFSIEGGESTIPALDCIIEKGAELGAREFVLGMAHRGRLNVLVNIFGKKPEYVFSEFEGAYKIDANAGEGDVKYHKGYSADFLTRGNQKVHLSLASNPSHLEFINPVVTGIARAKQDRLGDKERSQVIPIVIHGDAAFAGQGVCFETLTLSQLRGYGVGGSIHIVINNQVGFTTDPKDSRSTRYSTDLAKMLDSPIFHVNGDDPEAVWYVTKLATEFRQKFKADVFIDIVCYRKHGHNEGDEPSFTQPLLYKKIKAHPSTRELYAKKLESASVLPGSEAQGLVDMTQENLSDAQARAKSENPTPPISVFEGAWQGIRVPREDETFATVKTCVDAGKILEIATKINKMPDGFKLHSKLARFFDARLKAIQDGKGIDWGNAETLAFATLLDEGHPVRLSGQDVERGTFTHRHCVVHDFDTGQTYSPLDHVSPNQANVHISNSALSETGVLGFEYGYSLTTPMGLTIWEAQFGDFANGAQVIIDQFISSAESKWRRMTGIVLLLPHSYEGQGPEHSSARLERFLQLCGRNNMIVGNLTTPAQIFHALRRQLKRDFRKPLVIMSPKSLLRHPMAISKIEDLSQGMFQEVIDDSLYSGSTAAKAKRVLLCSGKVYYDLLAERAAKNLDQEIAIVRVEQLYPWPAGKLAAILDRYSSVKEFYWVQEEPRNMGAWGFVFGMWSGGLAEFGSLTGSRPVRYVGRDIGAAPAVGSHKIHEQEQHALINQALDTH